MLPDEILTMLTTGAQHGLTIKDAKTLVSSDDGDRLDFYLDALEQVQASLGSSQVPRIGRVVGNWYSPL